MEKIFKNTIFSLIPIIVTAFLVIFYWFGVIFYDYIDGNLSFSYVDELLTLFIGIFLLVIYLPQKPRVLKSFTTFILFCFFYLFYSFLIKSNVSIAIVSDFLVTIKPFLAYFSIQILSPKISGKYKSFLWFNALLGAAILPFLYEIYPHPSRYATAVVGTAYLFLYTRRFSAKNLFLFLLILALGLVSQRSKMYGNFIVSSMLGSFFYFNKDFLSNISFKKLTPLFSAFLAVLLVSYEKIYFYFYVGVFERKNMFARPLSYLTSLKIAYDYFPFGSGFASFGTFFSGKYYSSLYYKYWLSEVHGLTPGKPNFVSDTFFPALLSQFGVVGFFLFIYAAYKVFVISYVSYKQRKNLKKQFFMVLTILSFFTIESLADSTFTQNRGIFIVIILSLVVLEMKSLYIKKSIDNSKNTVN